MDLPEDQSAFLWGARKTGKSTYLKNKFPKALYIDFLKSDIYQKYLSKPSRLREELATISTPVVVILDEVQKVPLLLDEVHFLIENMKHIQFILCGSSARKLKMTGANLLGGRAWRYMFLPLCYPEIKELNWNLIFNNGLIPSHYNSKNPNKSLSSYIYDYLLTEVQIEANIRKREPFARFLDILGFSNGEMVNFSNIARECGVDRKTVMSYFEILEDMYLGYFIRPFTKSCRRQIVQDTPKFYLFDTGVANYLRRYEYKEMAGSEAGKNFEHYILLELMAYKLLREKREEIHYWRSREKQEVDFIFQNQAIEVKMRDCVEKNHIKSLLVFGREYNNMQLNVVCLEEVKRIFVVEDQEIIIWPIKEFLDNLWNNKIWVL